MSLRRSILVVGATGKQGGALINALVDSPQNPFDIYALTRTKTSAAAKRLGSKANVTVVEGNLDDIPVVFKQIRAPLWGVFAVPILDKGIEKEEAQSKALVDAAIGAGVSHLVFTATDRGGPLLSNNNPTNVPHFASKYRTEKYIISKAQSSGKGFTWTFLRPVAFYENMNPGFFGRAFISMWRLDGENAKVQLVATPDIGKIGAQAFLRADEPVYRNNAVSIAGDEITVGEVAQIFKEELGKDIPATYSFLAMPLRYAVKDLRMMFAWFKSDGFGADLPALRRDYPFLMDFRTWLRTESPWKKE